MAGANTNGVEKLFNPDVLDRMKKNELIDLILQLQTEKEEIREERNSFVDLHKRVVELERSQYLYEQYGRRESIEISGIPTTVADENLEDEVIKVYKAAKVEVFGRDLRKDDISACHRLGKKKETTIVRFTNRKFAFAGLINSKNLKDAEVYDNNVYINNSFCKEFSRYGFIIRRLKTKKRLFGYRVRHGVYQVQLEQDGEFSEVSHESDFAKYGLRIDDIQQQQK